jgi:hypothetical protein
LEGGLLADAQAASLQHGRKGLQGLQPAFETLAGFKALG